LIAAHVENVTIDKAWPDKIVVDVGALHVMQQLDFTVPEDESEPPTAQEILDKIAARLQARMAGGKGHPVYESLAKRLDDLRKSKLLAAEESVDFLKKILKLAKDVTVAVKADEEGRLDDLTPGILPDPHIGALTQIFREYAPEAAPAIIERVVLDIDEIVRQVRFVGWQTSTPGDRAVRREIRLALSKQGLQAEGALYDRAYEYVRENY
jgi:type I restriction enzyme R subunit